MELFTDLDLGMPGSFGRSEKLARYRGSHERLFFRSLNQLKQIQQERALRETDQKAALPPISRPPSASNPLRSPENPPTPPRRLTASATVPKTGVRERRERVSLLNLRPRPTQS